MGATYRDTPFVDYGETQQGKARAEAEKHFAAPMRKTPIPNVRKGGGDECEK